MLLPGPAPGTVQAATFLHCLSRLSRSSLPSHPNPPTAKPLPQGAVALPPTELGTWDVEDDIVASELALERHLAMREVRSSFCTGTRGCVQQ